jgi:hypothetical protein
MSTIFSCGRKDFATFIKIIFDILINLGDIHLKQWAFCGRTCLRSFPSCSIPANLQNNHWMFFISEVVMRGSALSPINSWPTLGTFRRQTVDHWSAGAGYDGP